jgi:recombination protein RecT
MSNNTQLIQSKSLKDVLAGDACKARFKEILGSRGPQMAAALVQLVNQSNQLQKCEPNSIIGCALMASALDLSIDPNLSEACIVPYGAKAQFQIMYGGLTQLALRSGQYRTLGWQIVHKDELETWDELTGELVVNSDHPDEEVIGYAAKFKLLNGFEKGSYWTKARCMAHAERFSKAYRAGLADKSKQDYSVWFTDPDRACLKTVLKMLLKTWGPKSIQMQTALRVDEGAIVNAETGEVDYIDTTMATEVSSPKFEETPKGNPPPPSETAKPVESGNQESPAKAAAPSSDAPTVNHLKLLRGMVKQAGLEEPEICNYLKVEGIAKVTKLEALNAELLEVLATGAHDLIEKVKKAKGEQQ